MAREILFKAKTAAGDMWVEGLPHKDYDGDWLISNGVDTWCINQNTLCQFTGILDKNGDKIWEGDLLRCEIGGNDLLGRLSVKNPIDHVIGTICYIDKIGRFTIEVRSNPLDIVGIEIGWGREQFEVIGNIHEEREVKNG